MKICAFFLAPVTLVLLGVTASAHEGHSHHVQGEKTVAGDQRTFTTVLLETLPDNSFSMNEKTYTWKHRDDLGGQSEAMSKAAIGGLHNNADEDPETQEVVTVVANHGLVTLQADLKEWTLLENQDPYFAKGMNAHGTDCFQFDDEVLWAFSSTNTREVVIAKRGEILARLPKPTGDEFENEVVNQYYRDGGAFSPCDVVWLPKAESLVVVTGYTPGDYALTAKFIDGQWKWSGPAWGGKVGKGGPFQTAHGVEVATIDGKETVIVASRGHGRIYGFDANGDAVSLPGANEQKFIALPEGSNPCNVSLTNDSAFLPLLNSLSTTNGVAPVLVMVDGSVVGNLIPASYDGLEYMHHMHGVCTVTRDGELFAIALSWPNGGENRNGKRNDGQTAVFQAVEVVEH
ncbi:NHL repeat-containing protein [Allorhodopirellula solitaria]|uniref:Uncharacterized protein n=1 Tax=Allorhodopirellula solitaria TaxID=2527987 RepID=A0A5C5YDM4_9BACT|nr:hypothetical protein [Allorhodopirellula solitaria]TWT72903.1 hypothetical protein CA85_13640 [Allorhodopirellula solitaria]